MWWLMPVVPAHKRQITKAYKYWLSTEVLTWGGCYKWCHKVQPQNQWRKLGWGSHQLATASLVSILPWSPAGVQCEVRVTGG